MTDAMQRVWQGLRMSGQCIVPTLEAQLCISNSIGVGDQRIGAALGPVQWVQRLRSIDRLQNFQSVFTHLQATDSAAMLGEQLQAQFGVLQGQLRKTSRHCLLLIHARRKRSKTL
ncbi:hypothetical protein D3C86_1773010 [compost metagenome]